MRFMSGCVWFRSGVLQLFGVSLRVNGGQWGSLRGHLRSLGSLGVVCCSYQVFCGCLWLFAVHIRCVVVVYSCLRLFAVHIRWFVVVCGFLRLFGGFSHTQKSQHNCLVCSFFIYTKQSLSYMVFFFWSKIPRNCLVCQKRTY